MVLTNRRFFSLYFYLWLFYAWYNRIHTQCVLNRFSCVFSSLTLCEPTDCSLPDSSVHGILQASILQWATLPSSRESLDPRIEPKYLMSSELARRFFITVTLRARWSKWEGNLKNRAHMCMYSWFTLLYSRS